MFKQILVAYLSSSIDIFEKKCFYWYFACKVNFYNGQTNHLLVLVFCMQKLQ